MSTSLRSNSVVLDEVDDYLAPSQACVNPLFQPKPAQGPDGEGGGDGAQTGDAPGVTSSIGGGGAVVVPRRRRRVTRQGGPPPAPGRTDAAADDDGDADGASTVRRGTASTSVGSGDATSKGKDKDVGGGGPKDAVKASIADCLACSGCVTTAETVLLEERHSLTSLRERLALGAAGPSGTARSRRAVTVSPNSWSDLCRHWNLRHPRHGDTADGGHTDDDPNFYYSRFATLLAQILSADLVVDGNVPLQWTWIDEAEEFCQVYERDRHRQIMSPRRAAAPSAPRFPSVAIDSTRTQYYHPDGTAPVVVVSSSDRGELKDEHSDVGFDTAPQLPLISGSCPALVCLVEKTLTALVPHLSQAMSPMSLLGTLLKNNSGSIANHQQEWDHWAIMPCHDKKLEASRRDFIFRTNQAGNEEHSVDLVISTQECVELVEEWILQQVDRRDSERPSDARPALVADYLATLPPSDVSTILDPKELSPAISAMSNKPLLVTASAMNWGADQTNQSASGTTTTFKQLAFSSGGHANFVFLYAAKKLFGCTLWTANRGREGVVEWKAASLLATKNVKSARLSKQQYQHYYEATLYRHPDGSYSTMAPSTEEGGNHNLSTPVLHFAIAHGMQTMQRALKLVGRRDTPGDGQARLHYLEAMACPYGCVNGGGSARSSSTTSTATNLVRETPTETRSRVKATVDYLDVPNPATPLTESLLKPSESDDGGRSCPRTRYHVVPAMKHTMGAVAGENVENIQW